MSLMGGLGAQTSEGKMTPEAVLTASPPSLVGTRAGQVQMLNGLK